MKFSQLSVLGAFLSLLPTQSSALKCGIKGVTEPCIGETDDRYNPDVSYNLKDQNDLWKNVEGLYVGTQTDFSKDGEKLTKRYLAGTEDAGIGTYDFSNLKLFLNYTIDGSRGYFQRYLLAKHNADGPVIPGLQLPGLVLPALSFFTSTYEKDGVANGLGIIIGFGQNFTASGGGSSLSPVAGKAMLGLENKYVGDIYESTYCVDSECNTINGYVENYIKNDAGLVSASEEVINFARIAVKKVDKATWMSAMGEALTDFSIPPPEEKFTVIPGFDTDEFVRPFDPSTSEMTPECVTLSCPSDEDWKLSDPVLGTSPYVEPDGVLTGGFIAGVTIASIVVAVAIFSFIYKRGVEAREKRVKEAVLKSIAQSMTITTSKALTPAELEKMFKKIDADGNGNLSKDEVKELVEEAGVANMSDRDYDVLFGSIDLDGNGTLDFTEFCAFFASMPVAGDDSFNEA